MVGSLSGRCAARRPASWRRSVVRACSFVNRADLLTAAAATLEQYESVPGLPRRLSAQTYRAGEVPDVASRFDRDSVQHVPLAHLLSCHPGFSGTARVAKQSVAG